MKRKLLIVLGSIGLLIILFFWLFMRKETTESPLVTEVQQGRFEVLVNTTGELQAKQSVKIRGPEGLRNSSLAIREVKILDLVAEGTVVDSGDYIARLDKTEALSKLQDIEDELEKKRSEYITTKLDTAMELKEARNRLIDLKYAVEEKEIAMKQSQYEPPATQRQAKIEYEKTKRELNQARENYSLKVEQAEAKMSEVVIDLSKQKRKKKKMEEMLTEFTIYAPQGGMVIYKEEWSGQKRKEGSTISPWDLTVATLPDLTSLISKTYVNEIDISKVKSGQSVRVKVDAFPNREYKGRVTDVANIGQELKRTGAKVFEVLITLAESDSILRPSMTTSNQIITAVYDNARYLPMEAVFSEDSTYYVYTPDRKKREVEVGKANENHIVVEGLENGTEVYLSIPDNANAYSEAGSN